MLLVSSRHLFFLSSVLSTEAEGAQLRTSCRLGVFGVAPNPFPPHGPTCSPASLLHELCEGLILKAHPGQSVRKDAADDCCLPRGSVDLLLQQGLQPLGLPQERAALLPQPAEQLLQERVRVVDLHRPLHGEGGHRVLTEAVLCEGPRLR